MMTLEAAIIRSAVVLQCGSIWVIWSWIYYLVYPLRAAWDMSFCMVLSIEYNPYRTIDGLSSALSVQNRSSRLFPLLASHPIALERRQRCYNAPPNPTQVLPLRRRTHWNPLHLYIRRRVLTHASHQILSKGPEKDIASAQQNVGVELLLDIHIAGIDSFSSHHWSPFETPILVTVDEALLDVGSGQGDGLMIWEFILNGGQKGVSPRFFLLSDWQSLLDISQELMLVEVDKRMSIVVLKGKPIPQLFSRPFSNVFLDVSAEVVSSKGRNSSRLQQAVSFVNSYWSGVIFSGIHHQSSWPTSGKAGKHWGFQVEYIGTA